MWMISMKAVLETIRYRVCQGHGNKEHICKRGSCAYCGIMEIMNDISSIEAADVQPVKQWYSVEENQPDSVGDDVLVVDSYGKYHIAYYLSGSENWMNQDTREPIKDVVKWRYLGGDSKWTH